MVCWPCKKKEVSEEDQSRRPSNSKFKQQRLPAWQPILTASTVLPIFFLIAITFVPIGIGLLVTSNNIKEKVIEYSEDANCKKCDIPANDTFFQGSLSNCKCTITIILDTKWEGDVYFYYGLSNYYQNHRRYVRSRDDNQLHGTLKSSVNSNCKPYATPNDLKDTTRNYSKPNVPFAPCGAIANSMFNDKFTLYLAQNGNMSVPLIYKNIAWESDRKTKFKNPKDLSELDKYNKPPYWSVSARNLDLKNDNNTGFLNQDFIVWMRVAAFPTFRKLYRKLNRKNDNAKRFQYGLPNGKYYLDIDYNYPVFEFNGKKRFILTTSSWIGGKNPFLGIAYIVVGCLCLVFGFLFLVIHMKVRTRPLNS